MVVYQFIYAMAQLGHCQKTSLSIRFKNLKDSEKTYWLKNCQMYIFLSAKIFISLKMGSKLSEKGFLI